MSSDPPIDNCDPKTQADETLKIALDAMASANAGHPPTLPHIRNVAGHALERIRELEAEVAELMSDAICERCGKELYLDQPEMEPTKYCHNCAHIAADEAEKTVAEIKRDIPTIHCRRCWTCGKTHWHADDHGKPVDCPECGSRDTRRVKHP